VSARRRLTRCEDVAPLLVFYTCGEVDEQERVEINAHLAACSVCAGQLNEEKTFQTALSTASQAADQLDPSGALLAQCRSELAERLDDLQAPAPVREHWMPFGWVRRWMAMRPAWSAAALVLVGLGVGTQMSPWFSRDGRGAAYGSNDEAVNVTAMPRLSDDELSKMAVAGINFAPSPDAAPGTLQLQMRTEQPIEMVGNVDDADMRRVLTYVVANGERFDPGVRLDCLDALRARASDAQVRRALLVAAKKDQNAAVRMKALEALRDSTGDEAVRETLLEALRHDANPGVRVEAVNLLVHSLQNEGSDEAKLAGEGGSAEAIVLSGGDDESVGRVVRALEDLQRRDPNRYVRLRSAAALRQISGRDLQ
jgi:HEAT repeats